MVLSTARRVYGPTYLLGVSELDAYREAGDSPIATLAAHSLVSISDSELIKEAETWVAIHDIELMLFNPTDLRLLAELAWHSEPWLIISESRDLALKMVTLLPLLEEDRPYAKTLMRFKFPRYVNQEREIVYWDQIRGKE
jgi:hypothetical protein